ncbi:MAG: PIN domain-containing protein [Candidatus Omnitrophica bacterium]|nr:PIN domain-containing protein [Candidatus Omnitrophota bacterium]
MSTKIKEYDYILDTSAVFTYLTDAKGANKVGGVISSSALPFLVYSELYYIVWNKLGKPEADKAFALVKSWDLPILLPSERIILNAGRLKAVYRLGIAGSYIAAFAIDTDKILVTSDEDFQVLKAEIKALYI